MPDLDSTNDNEGITAVSMDSKATVEVVDPRTGDFIPANAELKDTLARLLGYDRYE